MIPDDQRNRKGNTENNPYPLSAKNTNFGFELFSFRSLNRTCCCARTTIQTCVSINHELTVFVFADATNRASIDASAATQASINIDLVCHRSTPPISVFYIIAHSEWKIKAMLKKVFEMQLIFVHPAQACLRRYVSRDSRRAFYQICEKNDATVYWNRQTHSIFPFLLFRE